MPSTAALDLPCTPKYLPYDVSIDAARTAIVQNPINRPAGESAASTGMVLPPDHLAVLTSKYWGAKGVRLTVGFMEPTPDDLRKRILAHMNAWSEYANVNFVYSPTDSQVRITRSQEGYWSYLGTDIFHIPKNEATMCLQAFTMSISDAEFRRVVRHETGHTLGFPHEHMRSAIVNRIDPAKAIAYFKQTQGWSATMVQQQVLTPLAESSLMGTPDADETSVMTYSLPGIITRDGRPIVGGSDIAPQDIDFVAKIYPKQTAPPPPPEPPVGKGLDMNMDFAAKTVHLRLPPGWKVLKLSTQGEIPVENQAELVALGDELETCIPADGIQLEEAKASAIGGVIGKVIELTNALKAGDMQAAMTAFVALLNMLLGTGDGTISFQQKASAMKFDWAKLVSVLTKLLPILLGA